jgi:hypothetical protein
MKRPPHTFVVEVRRQRRSTNSNGKGWLTEPTPALSERYAGAAALFEAERKAPPAPAAAAARPQGRILPSLVDVEPSPPAFEEEAAPPRRKRERPAAASKPKTRAKKETGRELAPRRRPAPTAIEQPGPSAPPRSFEEPAAAWRGIGETDAVVAARPEAAAAERSGERQARHRRIMERYALGVELKPGERWKKRLRKAR